MSKCEEKIGEWLYRKLYREDVLQVLFADSDSEGDMCLLEMTIGRLMIALLPVHLCMRNAAIVHKAQTNDNFNTLANVDVVLVSIGELLLSDDRPDCVVCSDRERSKSRRQTVQVI